LIGAFLTAISPLMAQSGRVRIHVTDATGAAIPGAEASLLGADDKPQRTERANDIGEIVWTDLPFGECKIGVTSTGFATRRLVLIFCNSIEVNVDVQLQVGGVGGATLVEPDSSPLVAHLDPPAEVAKPPRPKRRWWKIFH
jgi:hypothetical protein